VALGLQLAAYYGLYFYPGCRDFARQWKVSSNGFTIRMRLPNPAYEVKGNDIVVHEKHYKEDREVGNGFRMLNLRRGAINHDQLARFNEKSTRMLVAISPFAPTPSNATLQWNEEGGSQNEKASHAAFMELLKGTRWEGRFSKLGDTAFGWTMPQALCLYPHADDTRTDGGGVNYPGYQQWPKLTDKQPHPPRTTVLSHPV